MVGAIQPKNKNTEMHPWAEVIKSSSLVIIEMETGC